MVTGAARPPRSRRAGVRFSGGVANGFRIAD